MSDTDAAARRWAEHRRRKRKQYYRELTQRRIVKTTTCQTCGAVPGEWCTTTDLHWGRR